MKLEFLAEGSKVCPLIRLYAFDQSSVLQLKDLVSALAAGTMARTALHRQPWIEPLDGCEFELRLGKRDQGVIQTGPLQFECSLSEEGWADIAFLLEPFCATGHPSGFQWLNERGKISLLISSSGMW